MKPKFSRIFSSHGSSMLLALAFGLITCGNLLWAGLTASAQTQPVTAIDGKRNFPAKSQLGTLTIGVFPEATLNGQATRFSASGRLYNTSNMIVQPSSVYNQPQVVRFELNFEGQINRAWLLNDAELKIAQDEAAARR